MNSILRLIFLTSTTMVLCGGVNAYCIDSVAAIQAKESSRRAKSEIADAKKLMAALNDVSYEIVGGKTWCNGAQLAADLYLRAAYHYTDAALEYKKLIRICGNYGDRGNAQVAENNWETSLHNKQVMWDKYESISDWRDSYCSSSE
ncbi:hypothetical protein [Lentibacter sp. XHP0401]|uniref:hypothetical protein n=1 Tax=Lentibacter sp. XHP0401 TaxID=2984334 RepID=UPI0021E8CE8D|nr:hypothetical protein [Lentibacter sp. XHP0401]MCV2894634.1 hypothetical protein [Lentibacter sp. XHP0401]